MNFIRYTQVEGVYFDETFVPIACIEFTRVLIALACHLMFMDVKSSFLNGFLKEEVYVA